MRKRCPVDCVCGKHARPNRLTEDEREQRRAARLAYGRDYMRENRHRFAESQRLRNKLHGDRYHIKSKYGITLEQRGQMLSAQNGCCYLCSEPLVAGSIHIDHDHACCRGKKSCGTCIRGLACQKCNQGIGQFGDDPDRMRRVADNLEMANAVIRGQRNPVTPHPGFAGTPGEPATPLGISTPAEMKEQHQ